jgi:membrane protein implicated in regulation of membrane protease activity
MSPDYSLIANIFLFMFLFGLVFTVVSVVLGLSHAGDFGGSHVHVGADHVGAHVGHAAHAGHAHAGAHGGQHVDVRSADVHIAQHEFEGGQDGLSVLNMPTIMAFITWFGGAGYIATRTFSLGPVFSVPVALLSGLTGGGIMFVLLARVLWPMRSQPMSRADYYLPGTPARVVSSIRPGGVGEIVYSKAGNRFTAGARSVDEEPVAKGTEVVILGYERGIASVQPVDSILNTSPPQE